MRTQQVSEAIERTDVTALNSTLSNNVRSLRNLRDFTFDELAERAGLSKGMLVQIEQARTNPSIGTLCKLANALGVTITRLLEEPARPVTQKTALSELPNLWKGPKGSVAKLLAGVDGADLVEFWHWNLMPGHQHTSAAHPPGTKELIYVLKGSLHVEIDTKSVIAKARESLLIPGDEHHCYMNKSRTNSHFAMVVIEPASS